MFSMKKFKYKCFEAKHWLNGVYLRCVKCDNKISLKDVVSSEATYLAQTIIAAKMFVFYIFVSLCIVASGSSK